MGRGFLSPKRKKFLIPHRGVLSDKEIERNENPVSGFSFLPNWLD